MIRKFWRWVAFKRVSCIDCGFLQRPAQRYAYYLDLRNLITVADRDAYNFGGFIECYVGAADLEKESLPTSEEYEKGLGDETLIQTVTKLRRCSSFTRFMPDDIPKEHQLLLHNEKRLRVLRWSVLWAVIGGVVVAAVTQAINRLL